MAGNSQYQGKSCSRMLLAQRLSAAAVPQRIKREGAKISTCGIFHEHLSVPMEHGLRLG